MRNQLSVIFVAAMIVSSCTPAEEAKPTDMVSFPLAGVVVEVDTSRLRVVITHDEIPDYMPAMTMPFKVRDRELLNSLEPGDSVTGILAISRVESWLADMRVVVPGEPAKPLSASGLNVSRLFLPGEELPDLVFLDQNAQRVRLGDYRGKVVALTFIYTRCPIPDFCIRMSDYFARIQRAMKKNYGKSDAWQLVTVSFDPVFDRPAVMRSYGENYGADFSRWSFLTDPDTSGRTLLRLAGGFDLLFEDDEGALIAHNLRTAVIDRNGVLVEVVRDNEWTPEQIVEKMERLMND